MHAANTSSDDDDGGREKNLKTAGNAGRGSKRSKRHLTFLFTTNQLMMA